MLIVFKRPSYLSLLLHSNFWTPPLSLWIILERTAMDSSQLHCIAPVHRWLRQLFKHLRLLWILNPRMARHINNRECSAHELDHCRGQWASWWGRCSLFTGRGWRRSKSVKTSCQNGFSHKELAPHPRSIIIRREQRSSATGEENPDE